MAQITFPAFTNMMPTVEDIQLIVDSLRQADRCRITRDGVFTPGIVNEKSDYLQAGTYSDSLKIKPFVAYTAAGNRIEVEDELDNLYAQGSIIPVTDENKKSAYLNIPVWSSSNVNASSAFVGVSSTTTPIKLADLGKGSVLHGIKVKTNAPFTKVLNDQIVEGIEVWMSIGTNSEPEKFLPPTLISDSVSDTNISAMNLLYSIDDGSNTDIIATFTCNSVNLSELNNGSVTVNLCIANLEGFDNAEIEQVNGGYELSSTSVGQWQPSTTYHIVARYHENPSNLRQLKYTTSDGTIIETNSEYTRYETSYKLFALRKTGTVIDYTTQNDIKLGEVVTGPADSSGYGHIIAININGKNTYGDDYTQYLTLPGYRMIEGINANQIGNGDVTNTQFSYLNTLTGNVQTQLGSKANLGTDNIFTGRNKFTEQIEGSIEKVNGFSANATPAPNNLLVLDENGKIPADALSESTVASIGNFYTVSSGVTEDGRSSFLKSNDENTAVIVEATAEHPLVLNYPDGSVEKLTSTETLTSIDTDGYYYLVKEQGGDFTFLPTSGGTMACIPVVGSNNSFSYFDVEGGAVSKTYGNTADSYKAFDGKLTSGTNMGYVIYKNYNGQEETSYLPSTGTTSLIIHFPSSTGTQKVTPTSFSACFRTEDYDITPKVWTLQATNVDVASALDTDWVDLVDSSSQNSSAASGTTWNKNEIKNIKISDSDAYYNFRFIFEVNEDTINNYMEGEQTDADGVKMPINCYYFQLYATNTSDSIKGNIIEGYTQPQNMSMGSYFLDISKKPYTGYKCTGNNTFTKINYVKLGFVNVTELGTVNASIICHPFCYNTFSISDENTTWANIGSVKTYTVSVAKNTPLTFDHNLGVVPNIINIKFQCLENSTNGYSAGDFVDNIYSLETINTTTNLINIKDLITASVTSITLWPGTASSTLMVKNKVTGAIESTSNNKWAAVMYCSRGW